MVRMELNHPNHQQVTVGFSVVAVVVADSATAVAADHNRLDAVVGAAAAAVAAADYNRHLAAEVYRLAYRQ